MIQVQSTMVRPAINTSQCSICGKSVRVSESKHSDTKVVCQKCRCTHCGIPISPEICRCGASHGSPSRIPGLCERCYVANHELQVPAVMFEHCAAKAVVNALLERAQHGNGVSLQ